MEGAVPVEGGGHADVDGGVGVGVGREVCGEDDIVAEVRIQRGDNQGNGLRIKAGILHDNIVDGNIQVRIIIRRLRSIEIKIDDLRCGCRQLRDNGLDSTAGRDKYLGFF